MIVKKKKRKKKIISMIVIISWNEFTWKYLFCLLSTLILLPLCFFISILFLIVTIMSLNYSQLLSQIMFWQRRYLFLFFFLSISFFILSSLSVVSLHSLILLFLFYSFPLLFSLFFPFLLLFFNFSPSRSFSASSPFNPSLH